ncbi:MAG: RluA family pseudouridine synthase [Muribaculaceae bacterium]|nr:RluA family pseudouridine synthase [Muribaculaceae bacterium]
MNNPFDYIPDARCDRAFETLLAEIERMRTGGLETDLRLCRELDEGKMLGVLIAEDGDGIQHELFSFSGQLGDGGFYHPGFVGPIFDYLEPDGYFRLKEQYISRLNEEIAGLEHDELTRIRSEYERVRDMGERVVTEYRDLYKSSKQCRDARRAAGTIDDVELAEMIRASQFEKAELRRVKRRVASELQPYAEALNGIRSRINTLKERRRKESEDLQRWLFESFSIPDARGERSSLSEIFAATPMGVPPTGAGECCAPKLLNAAYQRGWKPVAMAEYWYGRPKRGEVRRHGHFYPACRGKCHPVLSWMMQGLDIQSSQDIDKHRNPAEPKVIYENEWFCVVDKPSGLLSVPGKEMAESVEQWLATHHAKGREVRMAHRLDRDTSGLILAAYGAEAYKLLQSLFASHRVRKRYVADLAGDYREAGIAERGRIELPLSPDWIERPRQRVDVDNRKYSTTLYEFVGVSNGISRVLFYPLTGRTHQLRVHAASEAGLNMPIAGDRLYGHDNISRSERLHLHADRLEFTFPPDGRRYIFESPVPF